MRMGRGTDQYHHNQQTAGQHAVWAKASEYNFDECNRIAPRGSATVPCMTRHVPAQRCSDLRFHRASTSATLDGS
eukprot:2422177-Pleurochrysis_carterae.AAC.2